MTTHSMGKTRRKLARKMNRPPADTRNAPAGTQLVGQVTAISLATNSVTVTLNGDTTPIAGVSFLDSYMPVVGDNVAILRLGQHLWIVGSVAGAYEPIVGPGANTNISSSGGANRANTMPYLYTDHASVLTTTGSIWSYTSSGHTINGIGMCMVVPGAESNSLFALMQNQPTISGGNFSVNGAAYLANSSLSTGNQNGLPTSVYIQISVMAVVW